ncbi:hypothetical protein KW784_01965 [Candidatus Parcubacteria bacterium]|nr:hypothetical protein [Candidatus Parcubacteria bacterium]
MLRFSFGATRFVVLIGPFAVKIARIRIVWALVRIYVHLRNREIGKKAVREVSNPRTALGKICGIPSNHRESILWETTMSPRLVPTLWSCGLINIQSRGERVSQEELDREHPFPGLIAGLPEEEVADLLIAHNFCRFRGEVRLHDYGQEKDFILLMRAIARRKSVAFAA